MIRGAHPVAPSAQENDHETSNPVLVDGTRGKNGQLPPYRSDRDHGGDQRRCIRSRRRPAGAGRAAGSVRACPLRVLAARGGSSIRYLPESATTQKMPERFLSSTN